MKVLDDLLKILNFEADVREVRQGIFQTGVLTRNCGLAATLPRDALQQQDPSVTEAGFLLQKSAKELASMAYSECVLEAAIGMATINSLLELDEARCMELSAGDLIAQRGRGKKVAIVGHFPFIPKIRQQIEDLWVIEKNPLEGDYAETEAERLIPQAEVVAITGTAFTNHTIERLIKLCTPRAYVIVLGGTAPLSPVLFDYGIDAISGTKVVNAELTLRCISQGATYRSIAGIQKLTLMKGA
jgi:uncharacterized protein (DUF4213/DUF364 family)